MTSAINYPTNLPGPLVSSNAYTPKDRVYRNDLASGPPVYVLNDDSGWVMFDVSFRWTALQLQVWRNFYRVILASGARSFNVPLIVDGAPRLHECYVDTVPQATQSGKLWTVSFSLLAIEEVGIFSLTDTNSLIAAFDAFSMPLDQAVLDLSAIVALLEDLWRP